MKRATAAVEDCVRVSSMREKLSSGLCKSAEDCNMKGSDSVDVCQIQIRFAPEELIEHIVGYGQKSIVQWHVTIWRLAIDIYSGREESVDRREKVVVLRELQRAIITCSTTIPSTPLPCRSGLCPTRARAPPSPKQHVYPIFFNT
jgi:hypothetical protein